MKFRKTTGNIRYLYMCIHLYILIKIEITYDTSFPLQNIIQRKLNQYIKETSSLIFISAILTKANKWK
jgi:hypothetical protein